MAETTTRVFRPRDRRPGNALKAFPLPEVLQKMLDRGKAEMAQPMRGVTANGEPVQGLYPIQKTGIPLTGVYDAAQLFLKDSRPSNARPRASTSKAARGAPGTICMCS